MAKTIRVHTVDSVSDWHGTEAEAMAAYRRRVRDDDVIAQSRANALEPTGSSDIWRLRTEAPGRNDYPEPRSNPGGREYVPPAPRIPAELTAAQIAEQGLEYWSQSDETTRQWVRENLAWRQGEGDGRVRSSYQAALDRHWAKDAEGRTFTEICKFAMPDEAGNAEAVSEIDGGARYQLRRDVGGGSSLHREVLPESVVATGDCSCEQQWPGSRRTGDSRLSSYGAETRGLAQWQASLDAHWGRG